MKQWLVVDCCWLPVNGSFFQWLLPLKPHLASLCHSKCGRGKHAQGGSAKKRVRMRCASCGQPGLLNHDKQRRGTNHYHPVSVFQPRSMEIQSFDLPAEGIFVLLDLATIGVARL